jgi:phosphoenolpyruvate synthase/pyruvate phosphate dikinase
MTILPFTSPDATLQAAGGKGANLRRLTRAGFPVPRGFIVGTDAYQAFVATNRLPEAIDASIKILAGDGVGQLETISNKIRSAFSAGKMPIETETAIRKAFSELNAASVAVRSSATLEDLPDLSFAGQQDTYLNIVREDDLVRAVIDCWSSLWSARAIGYRMVNHISQDGAGLAVVVQEMVQSEVSGVLFTANPLTGLLSESVIDATFGLGEALVSGQVEPDHFVVNSIDGVVREKSLGSKRISRNFQFSANAIGQPDPTARGSRQTGAR